MLRRCMKRQLPSAWLHGDSWSPRLLLRALSQAQPHCANVIRRKEPGRRSVTASLPRASLPQHLLAVGAVGLSQLHASRACSSSSTSAIGNDEIKAEKWDEVVALLGEMAASKNRPSGGAPRKNDFELMPIYLQRVGITPERLESINFIHVAGTKGKGSTCAMVESILRGCGYRTGLYTSPHLVDVRERIRVDGQMLSRTEFAAAFWRVYGALRAAAGQDGNVGMPSFFYFMTLMAVDAFLARPAQLAPQVVVLEVGIGGRLDATNAVVTRGSLVAAAITSLGFDHMEMLGDTLPKIAREKAGIMKTGRLVLVAPQPQDAMEALQEVAFRVRAILLMPPSLDSYRLPATSPALPFNGSRASPITANTPNTANTANTPNTPNTPNTDGPSHQPLRLRTPSQPQEQEPPPVGRSASCVSQPGAAVPLHDAATAGSSDIAKGPAALLGVGGDHMRINAALAVALAAEWDEQYAAATGAGAAGAVAAAGRPVSLLPGGPDAEAAAARAAAVRSLELPERYVAGLRSVHWPGRSQVVEDEVAAARGGRVTFYLDGAHTPESMAVCATWFGRELAVALAACASGNDALRRARVGRHATVLLFNCMKERDPGVLLPALAEALKQARPLDKQHGARGTQRAEPSNPAGGASLLDAVIFTPMLSGGGVMLPPPSTLGRASATVQGPDSAGSSQSPSALSGGDLSWQYRMCDVWVSAVSGGGACTGRMTASGEVEAGSGFGFESGCVQGRTTLAGLQQSSVAGSLPEAIEAVRTAAAVDPGVHIHVLVTGSLYLVGDVLRLLNKPPL